MSPKSNLTVLLEEIQYDAVEQSADVGTLLRKCKVLAGLIGSTQLEQWATYEVLGYPSHEAVPEYRVWPLRLTGHFAGPFGKRKSAPIPLEMLSEGARQAFELYECRQSISTLQEHIRLSEDGLVSVRTGDLHHEIGRKMFRGYTCFKIDAEFGTVSLAEALSAVRDRVLDLSIALLKNNRDNDVRSDHNFQSNDQGPQSTQLIVSRHNTASAEDLEAWSKRRRMTYEGER